MLRKCMDPYHLTNLGRRTPLEEGPVDGGVVDELLRGRTSLRHGVDHPQDQTTHVRVED